MPLQVSFSPGSVCQGGNHFSVNVSIGPKVISVILNREFLLEPPGDDELEVFARVLLRAICRQLSVRTVANMRTVLSTKIIDLTVVG